MRIGPRSCTVTTLAQGRRPGRRRIVGTWMRSSECWRASLIRPAAMAQDVAHWGNDHADPVAGGAAFRALVLRQHAPPAAMIRQVDIRALLEDVELLGDVGADARACAIPDGGTVACANHRAESSGACNLATAEFSGRRIGKSSSFPLPHASHHLGYVGMPLVVGPRCRSVGRATKVHRRTDCRTDWAHPAYLTGKVFVGASRRPRARCFSERCRREIWRARMVLDLIRDQDKSAKEENENAEDSRPEIHPHRCPNRQSVRRCAGFQAVADWSPWLIADPACKVTYAEDGLSYRGGTGGRCRGMEILKEEAPRARSHTG